MAPTGTNTILDLPQEPETWYLTFQPLGVWDEIRDEPISQPYLLILVNLDNGMIMKIEMLSNLPKREKIKDAILETITRPAKSTGERPHRPQKVQFEDPNITKSLSKFFGQVGIEVESKPPPNDVLALLAEVQDAFQIVSPEPSGLLEDEEVIPELVGDLFSAAAEFYRSEPWEKLADFQVLAVNIDHPEKQGYVQLMGNAGLEFGLVLYWEWDDLLQVYLFESDPLQHLPASGWRSLTFENAENLPAADIEAVKNFGWEVADPDAHPMPVVYTPQSVERPPRDELVYYTALMRAIPRFIQEFLVSDGSGDYLPAEANIICDTIDGPFSLNIVYPAGELPEHYGWEPSVFARDESLLFDLNDEIGSLGQIEGEMAELFSRSGVLKLSEIQENARRLMYQAWREDLPDKRVELARKALELTPNCADAYVLLAEDEAQSLEEAYAYYQQGTSAGEQFLGADFFEEHRGDFWALPETRPYMRARQGLAYCLEEMGMDADALDNYRDMLLLNPPDNQGIRYAALALMLKLKKHDQASELLDEYSDEDSATWKYSKALIAFRESGDSQAARDALQAAIVQNKNVPDYLSGTTPVPEDIPSYMGYGDESEAIHYTLDHYQNWWGTKGAIDWMKRNS